jgi:hypothetical protein
MYNEEVAGQNYPRVVADEAQPTLLGIGVRTGRLVCKYFPTVRGDASMPSFSFNSLTIRSSPQVTFAAAMARISRCTSVGKHGFSAAMLIVRRAESLCGAN